LKTDSVESSSRGSMRFYREGLHKFQDCPARLQQPLQSINVGRLCTG